MMRVEIATAFTGLAMTGCRGRMTDEGRGTKDEGQRKTDEGQAEPPPNKFVLLCEAALRYEAREGATWVSLVIQRSIK